MSRSAASMDLRREDKFDRNAITIRQERVREERQGSPVDFEFAVYAGRHLLGRSEKRRHALKKAHQWIHNHRR